MTARLIACDIETLATDCIDKIFYNPEYVTSHNKEHIMFALIHEVNHIIRLHSKRAGMRDPKLWNVSTDYVINADILQSADALRINYDKDHGLFDKKYENWLEEDVYDDLEKKFVGGKGGLAPGKSGNGPGDPGNHDKWEVPRPEDEQKVRENVAHASEVWERSNQRGSIPGGLKKLIDKLRNPKVPWINVLRAFVGTAIQRDRYTYRKLRKTYLPVGLYKPSLHNPGIAKVVVAVDTSGSCNGLEMVFASEFTKLYDIVEEVTLIMADAEVNDVIDTKDIVTALKEHGFKGGGGTSHIPVFNYLRDNGIFPDVMICFTDGYTEFPEQQPPFPVMWCIPEGAGTSVPWGQVILIPEPDKLDDVVNL
jgi:predicted metal-dependent peptidase